MKKLAVFIMLIVFFSGCSNKPPTYQFPNQSVTIKSIELLHNMNPDGQGTDENNMVLLRTLNEEECAEYMAAIYSLPTESCGPPPPWGYGEYVTRITYENGDIEMYGPYNIELIEVGEEVWGVGDYYFPGDGYERLFAEYVNIAELPEPPKYQP